MAGNRILDVARANPYGATLLSAALLAVVAVLAWRPDNWPVMLGLAALLVGSGAMRLRETARRTQDRDD